MNQCTLSFHLVQSNSVTNLDPAPNTVSNPFLHSGLQLHWKKMSSSHHQTDPLVPSHHPSPPPPTTDNTHSHEVAIILDHPQQQHTEHHHHHNTPPSIQHTVHKTESPHNNPHIVIHHHYHHYDMSMDRTLLPSVVSEKAATNGSSSSQQVDQHGQLQQHGQHPLVLFNTPQMVLDKMKVEGIRKSKLTIDQMIISSLFAGVFKGVGCTMSLLTAGNSEWLETNCPGLQKFFFGA